MLFYTAAAIAASFATFGQAVKIESVNNADHHLNDIMIPQENLYSQIDAFQGQVFNNNQNN